MNESFRSLFAWQSAIKLAIAVYGLSESFPQTEKFGLYSQLRRAAISVPSNIAEGYGRISQGEYLQFLGQARGSLCEIETQLVLARAIGIGKTSELAKAELLCAETGRLLNGLVRRLKREAR